METANKAILLTKTKYIKKNSKVNIIDTFFGKRGISKTTISYGNKRTTVHTSSLKFIS